MTGVVLLTLFPPSKITTHHQTYPHFTSGITIALLGSLSSGFTYLAMRKCGDQVPSVVSPFWYGVFATGVFSVASVVEGSVGDGESDHFWHSWGVFGLLSVVGLLGWIS